MDARNPASNGAGHAQIPIYGANNFGPVAHYQQRHPSHQPMDVNGLGHLAQYHYDCRCHGYGATHSQQCREYNQHMFNLYAQQPPLLAPPPSFQQNQPLSGAVYNTMSGLRTDPDYEMKDMSDNNGNSNGGSQIEEVDKHRTDPDVLEDPADPDVVKDPQPLIHACGNSALENSTAKTHYGVHEQGSDDSRDTRPQSGGVSNSDEYYPVFHGCCNTPCKIMGQYYSAQGSIPAPSQPHSERRTGIIGNIVKTGLRSIGLVAKDEYSESEEHDEEKLQNRHAHFGSLKKEKEELQRRFNDLEKNSREALKKKDDELRQVSEDMQSRMSNLRAELQEAKTSIRRFQNGAKTQDSQIVNLTNKMDEYKAIAERLGDQLSSLEQSNSKAVAGTGAHKDSHAIPPNLLKALFAVKEAAFAFTKKFILYLKERNALDNYVALRSVPEEADERYRKHAVEAYISRRLFAGFENDCYVDSLDFLQGSQYLHSEYEENEFFLHHQDLEQRHERYLEEYESVQKLGLQGYMNRFKTKKAAGLNPFHRFCCRKLVNIMDGVDGFSKEFPPYADYSEHCLLYQLASDPKFCDQILKPFVTLTMAAYLLHRLAFQFNPSARIFRYARGTKFDQAYMENVFPIDDDVSSEGLIVGLMLSPGFQVGATIAKCKVFLVQSRKVTNSGSDPAKCDRAK